MTGYLLALVAALSIHVDGPPVSTSPDADVAGIAGSWQVCGAMRLDLRDTNPRGVENAKLVFHPDGVLEWRPAEATGPERSEHGRFESGDGGIRLLDRTGRQLGVLAHRGPDERVLSRDGRDGMLLCRLGDIAAADRILQPRSVAFFRSAAFDDDGIARNAETRQPPADSLLGTWEMARVVVRDPAHAWFGSSPYGWGSLRIAFDGRQMCFATLQPQASDVDRGCVPAQVRGLRVQADDDARGMLAPWLAGDVRITPDGVMRVPRRVYEEEYVWLAPGDLTREPLEGRITLVTFSEESD
ncbi:hypothetical protein LU699_01345 [Luteimonas fraxinea]|uniref:Lipocalin-like domain-containing protein n=1 Tax=Luteimonas fraxinea TaxID=2901869 RepID=A0ABS8UGY6_9GAMM|nr:hypothetical protein [Luteimonas fraxinea]MCD9098757.1 hypothetical protein [Luteimonas fraxinea]MCD9127497.1 hypothetical protein [Luteimonas fraxinea]UHH10412.1 hypothetical protein LU699_01345 [Luteimonas fraxinea]